MLPKLEQVKAALNERIEMGDLTILVTPEIRDPISYIGIVATSIAEQYQSTPGIEGVENAS